MEIDSLFAHLTIVRQMPQGRQCLLEVRCRFSIRRAGIGLGAGLPEIGQTAFCLYLSPGCAMRETLGLLDQPIRI